MPGAPQIVLTPEQIAYIAFARLHLEPLKPVIGPPPELNRWNMAAVGYPLWLSGGGDPHPPAVWYQVFNLRVRLEARVKSVDFLMGDGNVVTCDGPGLRWTPAVKPGEKSPVCGYQYAQAFITRRQLHSHGPDALERELDHQPPDRSHPDDSGIQR